MKTILKTVTQDLVLFDSLIFCVELSVRALFLLEDLPMALDTKDDTDSNSKSREIPKYRKLIIGKVPRALGNTSVNSRHFMDAYAFVLFCYLCLVTLFIKCLLLLKRLP